jgi:GH35 family endo-1,4-beta-xylanase
MEESKTTPAKSDRRNFLKYLTAATAGAAAGFLAGSYVWPPPPAPQENTTETVTVAETETVTETFVYLASLRAAAEAKGLLIGSVTDNMTLNDPRFADILTREFDYVTPDGMAWSSIDQSGYGPSDAVVKFASSHKMRVKGHPLIWHANVPSWIGQNTSPNALQGAIRLHIRGEVAHYRGKVYAWNVVNEAVESDGLRKSIFLEKLGEDYIAEAFRLAHEADPNALLFYNDYDAEAAGGLQKSKSDQVYELVRKLVNDGVPIHGVGLQMHLFAVEPPNPEDIAANIRRLAALGLKVSISEMEVRIKELPLAMSERLEMQRRIYHDVIAACMREKAFTDITFWGFTDAHAWANEPGNSGPDWPLLFDENYQPKPAYWGVMDALMER